MDKPKRELLQRICGALLLTAFFVCITAFSDFQNGCCRLREDMLRLHILADSDSADAQALKLAVRDRLIESSARWAQLPDGKEAAMAYLTEHLDEVEKIACDVLAENDCSLSVKAELTRSFFGTRVYGERTVPAGWYDSLRVTLGEGRGQNWWCVLYPPLCLPAAEGEAILEGSFTDAEKAVLSSPPRYRICFLTVELAEKFLNWLQS